MEFIDNKTIANSATLKEWIDAMEKAMQAGSAETYNVPKRMHLDHGKNTFLLMPCFTDEYWTTKLVSYCPDNMMSGHPSLYGTVVLNNTNTGEPLAIMDGGMITAMRTAAVTAVGIKKLSPVSSHSLGIIGTGTQGLFQAIFACSVRQINEIWAYDRNKLSLNRFSVELNTKYPDIKIHQVADTGEVALLSEVIISSTNSQNPVFMNSKEIFTGKTFVGIGSYKPDAREFPEQLFRQLDQIFVDTLDAKSESGDLIIPVKNNWISEANIYPLGKVISGEIVPSSNPTRFFKTVGSAIFDLFAAKLIYEKHIGVNYKNVPDPAFDPSAF